RLLQLRLEGGPAVGESLRDARRGPGAVEGARPANAVGRRPADLVPRGLSRRARGRVTRARSPTRVGKLHPPPTVSMAVSGPPSQGVLHANCVPIRPQPARRDTAETAQAPSAFFADVR